MAKAIFNIDGGLYRICPNADWTTFQTYIDVSLYKVIDITDDEFNDLKWEKKTADSYSGETISYSDAEQGLTETGFNNTLDHYKETLKDYTDSDKTWKQSEVTAAMTAAEGIDVSGVTWPLDNYFFKYLEDNSIAYINPLQLD